MKLNQSMLSLTKELENLKENTISLVNFREIEM